MDFRADLRPDASNVDYLFFFFQAEDGIRDHCVTGVQTCALPISDRFMPTTNGAGGRSGALWRLRNGMVECARGRQLRMADAARLPRLRRGSRSRTRARPGAHLRKIGRASCRERVTFSIVDVIAGA